MVMVVFILQTLVMPLFFFWALFRVLMAMFQNPANNPIRNNETVTVTQQVWVVRRYLKSILCYSILLGILIKCVIFYASKGKKNSEFQGYYSHSFEMSSFVPCGSYAIPSHSVGYWLGWESGLFSNNMMSFRIRAYYQQQYTQQQYTFGLMATSRQ